MKIAISLIAACSILAGCVAVPYPAASRACDLLQIASDEGQLAPAWYISAGEVLEVCGKPDARKSAEIRACYADRWNGYNTQQDCEAIE